jgi:hypothetical protein
MAVPTTVQDYCITSWTNSTVSVSQHCHGAVMVLSGGCLRDSMQDYCIRPWTNGAVTSCDKTVMMLSAGCLRDSMQDYCIRPWTNGACHKLS